MEVEVLQVSGKILEHMFVVDVHWAMGWPTPTLISLPLNFEFNFIRYYVRMYK